MEVKKKKAEGVLGEIIKEMTPERLQKTKEKMERQSFFQMLYWYAGESNYEIDGEKFENEPTYLDPKIVSSFAEDIMDIHARQCLTKMFIEFLKSGKYKDCIIKNEDYFKKLVARIKYEWDKYNETNGK